MESGRPKHLGRGLSPPLQILRPHCAPAQNDSLLSKKCRVMSLPLPEGGSCFLSTPQWYSSPQLGPGGGLQESQHQGVGPVWRRQTPAPHLILALHEHPTLAVVAVSHGRQLPHELVVGGNADQPRCESLPQLPVALGPQVAKYGALEGGPGHVDAFNAVTLLPQAVNHPGAHSYFIDVDLLRLKLPNSRGYPAGQLHGVQPPEGPHVLYPLAPAQQDYTLVGAEAGHIHHHDHLVSTNLPAPVPRLPWDGPERP